MKVSISYPAMDSSKGVPLLSQNRQFQWFKAPTYIYPVVPAYLATYLQEKGHQVFWDDGIAEELNESQWWERFQNQNPDLVIFESKTPVIKRHWRLIEKLKEHNPKLIAVLVGDHVTGLPEESMQSCPVDYLVVGGDYDFVVTELCEHLSGKRPDLPKGVWYRQEGQIKSTGPMDLEHDLNQLPLIDRQLTRWELYAYKNGNFKYLPGTYIMAGRDCWWGRCTFCSWTTLYPGKNFRTVTVDRHLDEIGQLIQLGVKEIFDDSGCFPRGEWLREFCTKFVERGYHKKVTMGCNMRVNALTKNDWSLLKKANFRFILIGLESVVQSTLDRLDKGIKTEQIADTVRQAKAAGLEPHITTMVGYPWESKEDSKQTIQFAKKLFTDGHLDTLQATIVVPYPGTPLFDEAKKNGWLLTEDWDDYDMKQSVWKSPVTNKDVMNFTQELYKAALGPKFIFRKLTSIRSVEDVKFIARAGQKLIGHLLDFKH